MTITATTSITARIATPATTALFPAASASSPSESESAHNGIMVASVY